MSYEIKFHRYFNNGSLSFTFPIPENLITKYPELDKGTTSRMKVWEDVENKTNIPNHVVNSLFVDDEFIDAVRIFLSVDQAMECKFTKSFTKHASNFYFSFINTNDGGKIKKQRSVKKTTTSKITKKEKAKKVKKINIEKEKRKSYQASKRELSAKVSFLSKMAKWDNQGQEIPHPSYKEESEIEDYLSTVSVLFGAYKDFFEEMLTAKNIPFLVKQEYKTLPRYSYSKIKFPGIYCEYILLDNKDNVDTQKITQLNWRSVVLSWFPVRKKTSRYNRILILNQSDVRISFDKSAKDIYKSDTRKFSTLTEKVFSANVEEISKFNNASYDAQHEDFISLDSRNKVNDAELDKLKKYISKKVIPYADNRAFYISGSDVNLYNDIFRITYGYSTQILQISIEKDILDRMNIKLRVFDKQFEGRTAKYVIDKLNTIFNNDIKGYLDVYKRLYTLKEDEK